MVKMVEWRETKQLQLQPPSVIFVSLFLYVGYVWITTIECSSFVILGKTERENGQKRLYTTNEKKKNKIRQHVTISFSTLIFYKIAPYAQSEVYLNAKLWTIQINLDQDVIFAFIFSSFFFCTSDEMWVYLCQLQVHIYL